MENISREEAIRVMCREQSYTDNRIVYESMGKAISDMVKLENIEQAFNCELKDVSQAIMIFQEIEKIVKEV